MAGFTATDTAKVNAERANLALRILPESSSRILPMSYVDFFLSRLAVTCEFFKLLNKFNLPKKHLPPQLSSFMLCVGKNPAPPAIG